MDSSAKVKGQQPCLEGQHLNQEGKNKPVWWAELHTLYSAVMEDLNRTRVPLSGFLDSGVVASSLATQSGKWQWKAGLRNGCPGGAQPCGNHYGNQRGALE